MFINFFSLRALPFLSIIYMDFSQQKSSKDFLKLFFFYIFNFSNVHIVQSLLQHTHSFKTAAHLFPVFQTLAITL